MNDRDKEEARKLLAWSEQLGVAPITFEAFLEQYEPDVLDPSDPRHDDRY